MNKKEKAEEFFWKMLHRRKTLVEIPHHCSQGENGILAYLAFVQNKITPSELSENLGVSLPRIVSALNSLESKNLIVKNVDSIDKRKTIIDITEEGNLLVKEKKDEAICKVAKVLEKLEEKEVDEYIRLTEKIVNIIEETQD